MEQYELPNGRSIICNNKVEAGYIYSEVFLEKVYTLHGVSLNQDSVVIDAGANIGLFSLYVLENFSKSLVYAFEPSSHLFNMLERNTKLFSERCKIFNVGLSNFEEEKTFSFYPHLPAFSTFFLDADGDKNRMTNVLKPIDKASEEVALSKLIPQQEICKLVTLSSIIKKEKIKQIDLLKMDVQRAELYVLKGINDDDWSKIKQVSFELHHIGKEQTQEIEQLLIRKGFSIEKFKDKFFEEEVPVYMMYAIRKQ